MLDDDDAVRFAMGSIPRRRRGREAVFILALSALCLATDAGAVTLHDLRDSALAGIYGEYAPSGKCDGPHSSKIDEEGFYFRVDSEKRHPASFEYALSFFGPDYSGISLALFPFPIDENEPGRVLTYVNAEEIEGRITFEENLGTGERLAYSEARIVGSSPWQNCASKKS